MEPPRASISCLLMVANPWSDVMSTSVVSRSFGSASRKSRICFRLASALAMAARAVGPLMPGTRLFRLSP